MSLAHPLRARWCRGRPQPRVAKPRGHVLHPGQLRAGAPRLAAEKLLWPLHEPSSFFHPHFLAPGRGCPGPVGWDTEPIHLSIRPPSGPSSCLAGLTYPAQALLALKPFKIWLILLIKDHRDGEHTWGCGTLVATGSLYLATACGTWIPVPPAPPPAAAGFQTARGAGEALGACTPPPLPDPKNPSRPGSRDRLPAGLGDERALLFAGGGGKPKIAARPNSRKAKSPAPGLSSGERPPSVSSVHSEGDCNRRTPLTNRVWEDRPSSAGRSRGGRVSSQQPPG